MGVSSLPWGNHGEWNGSQLRLPKRADGRKVEAKKNLQASFKITPQRQSDGFIARRTIVEWGWRGLVSGDKVRGALTVSGEWTRENKGVRTLSYSLPLISLMPSPQSQTRTLPTPYPAFAHL